jgi:hypothetical protein
MPNEFTFPPCRPHPSLNDSFLALKDARRYWNRHISRASSLASARSSLSSGSSGSTPGQGLHLAEVRAAIDDNHGDIEIYVSERNMSFWKVVMEGPTGSPYQGGVFLLYVDISLHFPRAAPDVRFITPILHPNISKAFYLKIDVHVFLGTVA